MSPNHTANCRCPASIRVHSGACRLLRASDLTLIGAVAASKPLARMATADAVLLVFG